MRADVWHGCVVQSLGMRQEAKKPSERGGCGIEKRPPHNKIEPAPPVPKLIPGPENAEGENDVDSAITPK